MINTKITKGTPKEDPQEKLFKLLEGIDWKLWEIYNMMKDNLPAKEKTAPAKPAAKKTTKTAKTEE
jgi:hypothetical protein